MGAAGGTGERESKIADCRDGGREGGREREREGGERERERERERGRGRGDDMAYHSESHDNKEIMSIY